MLLLPQILNFIQSLRNNTSTEKDEGQLVKAVDEFFGPQLIQDSSTLETPGEILVNNLKSNITLTPLPNDPLFGGSGLFANLGDVFSSKKKEVVG